MVHSVGCIWPERQHESLANGSDSDSSRRRRCSVHLKRTRRHHARRLSGRSAATDRAPDRGVAESVVMQIGGWKTAAMFRRYAIVSNKDKVIAMEKLEAQRVQNSHSSAAEAQTGKAIVQ